MEKLNQVFDKIDADGNGTLTHEELLDAFSKANGRTSKGIRFFHKMDI